MTTINTKLHGLLDYSLGILLMLSPWVFKYSRDTSAEFWIPFASGVFTILYTMFTDAEFGFVKKIKLSNHFIVDLILGSFLVISPKLFNYSGYVYLLPYLWIGLVKIFISLAAGNILHSNHIQESTGEIKFNNSFKFFFSQVQGLTRVHQKASSQESSRMQL